MIEYGTTSEQFGACRRDTARPCRAQPAGDDAQADHARGPPGIADDRRPAAAVRLLHRERRRLRRDRHRGRTVRATCATRRRGSWAQRRAAARRAVGHRVPRRPRDARVGAHGARRLPVGAGIGPARCRRGDDLRPLHALRDHLARGLRLLRARRGRRRSWRTGASSSTASCPSTPTAATTPRRTSTVCRTSSRPSASCAAPPRRRSQGCEVVLSCSSVAQLSAAVVLQEGLADAPWAAAPPTGPDTQPFWDGCREGQLPRPGAATHAARPLAAGADVPVLPGNRDDLDRAIGRPRHGLQLGRRHPPGRRGARRPGAVRRRAHRPRGGRAGGRATSTAAEPGDVSAGDAPSSCSSRTPRTACACRLPPRRPPRRGDTMKLEGTTALVIIDMQNGFCSRRRLHEQDRPRLDVERGGRRADPAAAGRRARGGPTGLLHRYSLNAGLLGRRADARAVPGDRAATGGWCVAPGTPRSSTSSRRGPGDRIDKTRYSAFYETDLEERLRALGVDGVVVCGVTTNVCVESTVRDAFFRDIRIIVPSDATAAVTPELHEAALRGLPLQLRPGRRGRRDPAGARIGARGGAMSAPAGRTGSTA